MLSPEVPEFIPRSLRPPEVLPRTDTNHPSNPSRDQQHEALVTCGSPDRHTSPHVKSKPQSSYQMDASRYGCTSDRAGREMRDRSLKSSFSESPRGHGRLDISNWRVRDEAKTTLANPTTQAYSPSQNSPLRHQISLKEVEQIPHAKDDLSKTKGKAKKYNYVSSGDYFPPSSISIAQSSTNDTGISYTRILQRNRSKDVPVVQERKPPITSTPSISMPLGQWPTLGDSIKPNTAWGKKKELGPRKKQSAWVNDEADKTPKESLNNYEKSVPGPVHDTAVQHHSMNSNFTVDTLNSQDAESRGNVKSRTLDSHKVQKSEKNKFLSNLTKTEAEVKDRISKNNHSRRKSKEIKDNSEGRNSSTCDDNKSHKTKQGKEEELAPPIDQTKSEDTLLKLDDSDPFKWQVQGAKRKQAKPKDALCHEKEGSTHADKKLLNKDHGKKYDASSKQRKTQADKLEITSMSHQSDNPKHNKMALRNDKPKSSSNVRGKYEKASPTSGETPNPERGTVRVDKLHHEAGADIQIASKTPAEAKPKIPLDEKATQARLETKQKKKEEKIRNRENKIKQRDHLKVRSDSKVTLISRDFLENTVTRGYSTSSSGFQQKAQSIEEYPSLQQMPVSYSGVLPKRSPQHSFPTKAFESTFSKSRGKDVKIEGIKSSATTPHQLTSEESTMIVSDRTPLPDNPISYSGAVQVARSVRPVRPQGKKVVPELPPATNTDTLPKKKVKTRDRIEFDLFAAARKSRKRLEHKMTPKDSRNRITGESMLPSPKSKGLLRTEKRVEKVENRGKYKKKKKYVSHVKRAFIKMKEERAQAIRVLFQDVTDRKLAEQRIKWLSVHTPHLTVDLLSNIIKDTEAREGEQEGKQHVVKGIIKREDEKKEDDKKEIESENVTEEIDKEVEEEGGENGSKNDVVKSIVKNENEKECNDERESENGGVTEVNKKEVEGEEHKDCGKVNHNIDPVNELETSSKVNQENEVVIENPTPEIFTTSKANEKEESEERIDINKSAVNTCKEDATKFTDFSSSNTDTSKRDSKDLSTISQSHTSNIEKSEEAKGSLTLNNEKPISAKESESPKNQKRMDIKGSVTPSNEKLVEVKQPLSHNAIEISLDAKESIPDRDIVETNNIETPIQATSIKTPVTLDPERARWILTQEQKVLMDPLHSKKFRDYCNQMVTEEVNVVTAKMLRSIVQFQNRLFLRDPKKGTIKRRYVCGLKQTAKMMGKISCVVMAPNIAKCYEAGGLDEAVEKTLQQAKNHGVPVVFALSKRRLAYICFRKMTVSCIGIINYQGAQDSFNELMSLVPEAQEQYRALVESGQRCQPPPLLPEDEALQDIDDDQTEETDNVQEDIT